MKYEPFFRLVASLIFTRQEAWRNVFGLTKRSEPLRLGHTARRDAAKLPQTASSTVLILTLVYPSPPHLLPPIPSAAPPSATSLHCAIEASLKSCITLAAFKQKKCQYKLGPSRFDSDFRYRSDICQKLTNYRIRFYRISFKISDKIRPFCSIASAL